MKFLFSVIFFMLLAGCGGEDLNPELSFPPENDTRFEEGTGTVVLSGRIN